MHDNIKRWEQQALLRILHVHSVDVVDGRIKAIITTTHFGRVTRKPYEFSLDEWATIIERGWIE